MRQLALCYFMTASDLSSKKDGRVCLPSLSQDKQELLLLFSLVMLSSGLPWLRRVMSRHRCSSQQGWPWPDCHLAWTDRAGSWFGSQHCLGLSVCRPSWQGNFVWTDLGEVPSVLPTDGLPGWDPRGCQPYIPASIGIKKVLSKWVCLTEMSVLL